MRVKVDVDTKTFVRFLLVVTGFVGAVFLVWKLWASLLIIVIAVFLALALNSPVSALSRRLPGHSRVLATAISYLVVLAVIGVFIYIALPPIVDQTNKFVSSLPQYAQEISSKKGAIADFVNHYNLQDQINQLVAGAQQQAGVLAQGIGSSVITGVSSILSGVLTMVVVLVLTFLMLVEGPQWLQRMWGLYDNQRKLERHQRLAVKMYNVVTGFVNGQVLVATIAACLALTFLIIITNFFQVPLGVALPLSGIVFVLELIPIIGATIAAVIVATVLAINDLGAALAYIVYFVIYIQIESNFIAPLVQSRKVALSALSVIIAIVLGISLLGIVGGIIAIPVAGCIRVLLLDYIQHRRKGTTAKRSVWSRVVAKTQSE